MPELPEVETVTRGLAPALTGRRIVKVTLRRDGLRFPFPAQFAEKLTGRTIRHLARRAKYIVISLDGPETLLVHLGMTGRFTVIAAGAARNLGAFYYEQGAGDEGAGTHDHVVLTLDDGTRVVYTDPRRFGVMDLYDEAAGHKLINDLGIEPLGNEFSADYLAERFRGKSAPLKAALLDQRIVAGLGNIYVCEALFRARLSPARKAGSLVKGKRLDPRLVELARHIRDVLTEAIAAGGSTLQDFAHTDGAEGGFQQRFAVYDREGEACPSCGRPLRRSVQAGRSTFHCATCQK